MNFGGAHDTCFKYVFGCLLHIYEKEKKRREENRSEALEIKNNNNNRNTEQEQKRVGKSKSIKFAILDLHLHLQLPGFVVMAVNPQLFPNGMPVPFVNELFVLARDGVEFEVDKIPGSVSSSFWFFSLFLT